MFRNRRKSSHRREFLLDSKKYSRRGGKKFRNKFLNFFSSFLLFKHLVRFLRFSFLFSGGFGLIAIFILVAVFSPYFNLKKISFVRDALDVDIEEVEESLTEFYGKNLLFLSDDKIIVHLKELFPEFNKININEKWPSGIEITIKVSEAYANIFNEETANFWVISENGIILDKEADERLPVIKISQYDRPISFREKFMEKEKIASMLSVRDFIEKELKIKIKGLRFLYASNEFHLITELDTEIWIDFAQSLEFQLKRLRLSAEEIGLYTERLNHIDLRIPGQIFWR